MAVQNPPVQPAPVLPQLPSDWIDRLINAVVVLGVALGVFLVFWQIGKLNDVESVVVKQLSGNAADAASARQTLQMLLSQSSSLFGTLTTFLGTAIGAYFGISVSASATKSAVTAANTLADQNASTKAENASLKEQLTAKTSDLSTLADGVRALNVANATHASDLSSLQRYAMTLK